MSLPDSNLAEFGEEPAPAVEKQRANVYTVMLILSFLSICAACVCLYAEMKRYDMDFKANSAKSL